MNKIKLKKLKYYLFIFWLNLKKLFTFIQSNADIFIALLPSNITEEIKTKIALLINTNIPGNKKQRIVSSWLINDVLIKLPPDSMFGKFYLDIPEKTRKHLVNMAVTKIFAEVHETFNQE